MIRRLLAAAPIAVLIAALWTGPLAARQASGEAGPDMLDISAADNEIFNSEGRVVYIGDVNVIRGDERLRADRVEAFFRRDGGSGFRGIERIVAVGDVFYITPGEVARGDRGVYDLVEEHITMTGSVVLTRGCNVSTGDSLFADLNGGSARLTGGDSQQRVRSVFFDEETEGSDPADCPPPTIPGDGPAPFDG